MNYKFSHENASIKRLIMTLFLVFDIFHITNIANLLWWPLQLQALSEALVFHFMSISHLSSHISLEPSSFSMILACGCWEKAWCLGMQTPHSLRSWCPQHFKSILSQGSLHHILHNVSLLLFSGFLQLQKHLKASLLLLSHFSLVPLVWPHRR